MKMNTSFNSLIKSPLQIILTLWFIIFTIFSIQVPTDIAKFVDSPLGMVSFFSFGVILLFYTHPLVTITYIIYLYELMRRSTKKVHTNEIQTGNSTPILTKPKSDMKILNRSREQTLEENMVQQMAPIGKRSSTIYVDSPFKPVSDNMHNAFVLH